MLDKNYDLWYILVFNWDIVASEQSKLTTAYRTIRFNFRPALNASMMEDMQLRARKDD
jgi:hypothetical protein